MTEPTRRWLFADRMRQPMRGLDRLSDLDALVEQERARGGRAP